MARTLIRKVVGAVRSERVDLASEPPRGSLEIEIDEREGWLHIHDPRAFRVGRRGFCRRLIASAAEHPGFERAEVDLHAASCRLRFDPGSANARSMADAVTSAVREASSGPIGDGPWWRRDGRWSRISAFRAPEGLSWWETIESRSGEIRLRHEPSTRAEDDLGALAEILAEYEGIEQSRFSPWSKTLTIAHRPGAPIARRLVDKVEDELRTVQVRRSSLRRGQAEDVAVASGLRRIRYLILAGGSFVLSVVGLIVPGIPTVPFLLSTSYYLARSSPTLNARLRRMPVLGPVLVEWEERHGLSLGSKARLMGTTGAVIAITVVASLATPIAIVIVFIISALSLYGIARIPGLPSEADAPRLNDGQIRRAVTG